MKRKTTKVAKALAYMAAHPTATAYAAAQHANMVPTALYKRLKADEAKAKGVCPCCGRPLGR